MRRILLLATVLATGWGLTILQAQEHPSFAGKWVLDAAKSDMGAAGGRGGGMGWGQEFTITQDATTLKIERAVGGNPMSETYKLDGSESKNPTMMGRGGSAEVTSTAKWDAAKLVIESKQAMNMRGTAMAMTTTRTLSLDASGNLVVETTRSGMQGNMMTSKMVYKKQQP